MINFRFHLVSLVAVFLALTVGIVMGATVIDRAIVDGLNDRIDAVNRKADARKRENDQLATNVEQLNGFVGETQPYLVNGRLAGVPVVVVAVRGVSSDTVKAMVQTLQDAGAIAPGIVWLENAWSLKGGDVDKLATTLGESTRDPTQLRDAAWRALSARLRAGQATPASVTPAGAPTPAFSDALTALTNAGFVTLEAVRTASVDPATFPGRGARAVLLAGPTPGPDPAELLRAGARATVAEGLPTVVGEVFVERANGPDRGATLSSVRDDRSLASVSSVDDVELPEGRTAVVLALVDLGRQPPVSGHYGYGGDAEHALPPWTP